MVRLPRPMQQHTNSRASFLHGPVKHPRPRAGSAVQPPNRATVMIPEWVVMIWFVSVSSPPGRWRWASPCGEPPAPRRAGLGRRIRARSFGRGLVTSCSGPASTLHSPRSGQSGGHVGVVYQFGEISGQMGEAQIHAHAGAPTRASGPRHRFDNVTAFLLRTGVFGIATVNYSVSAEPSRTCTAGSGRTGSTGSSSRASTTSSKKRRSSTPPSMSAPTARLSAAPCANGSAPN